MQLTTVVIFLFSSLFLKCSSQENTESEAQYSTEGSSSGTQTVNWDTPDPTSGQNVGRRRYEQNIRATPDYTTLFPNQRGPMMMPMMQQPVYGTRIPNADMRGKDQDLRESDQKPRRQKESQVISTSRDDQYLKLLDAFRNRMNGPFIPYSPYMFYPSQNPDDNSEDTRYSIPNSSANDMHPLTLQDLSEKMNFSASSPDEYFYRLPNTGFDERLGRVPFPFMRYPPPEVFQRNRFDGRNPESIPLSSYALPPYGLYPPLPPNAGLPTDDRSPQVYPQVDIFVRPPYFDREPGSENFEYKDSPVRSDASATPIIQDVPSSTQTSIENVPSESIPRAPLPINPFPFGYFPPGIAPPPLIPFPQGEIPPPILPPRLIPNPTASPADSLPPRIPTVVPLPSPQETPIDRLPNIPVPPLPASISLPPSESSANIPVPVPEAGTVPEVLPPPGGPLIEDKELYEFGFDMNDGKGTDQHRQESKDEAGVVTGSYGYRDAFGVYRLVNYIADKNGYRAFIQSNEPGVANPGSADVVVMAERPPPQTIAESLKPSQPVPVEVPDDLIVQASETK